MGDKRKEGEWGDSNPAPVLLGANWGDRAGPSLLASQMGITEPALHRVRGI